MFSVFKYLLKLDVILKAHCYAAKMSSEKHVCKVVQGLFQCLSPISSYVVSLLLPIAVSRMKKNVPLNVA